MTSMPIDRNYQLPRAPVAAIALSVAGGLLGLWMLGGVGNAKPEPPASVRVSVSLLDMSRLAPHQFGDWEPAPPPGK